MSRKKLEDYSQDFEIEESAVQVITGPQGPIGLDGAKGPVGNDGPAGATGIQGIKGDTGDVGRYGIDPYLDSLIAQCDIIKTTSGDIFAYNDGTCNQNILRTNLNTTISSQVISANFSPNGLYLFLRTTGSQYLYVYKINKDNDTMFELTFFSIDGEFKISADGNYLSIFNSTPGSFKIYRIDYIYDTFTLLTNPTWNSSALYASDFSKDGKYLVVAHNHSTNGNGIYLYQINKTLNTFTEVGHLTHASIGSLTFLLETSILGNIITNYGNGSRNGYLFLIDSITNSISAISSTMQPTGSSNYYKKVRFSNNGLHFAVGSNATSNRELDIIDIGLVSNPFSGKFQTFGSAGVEIIGDFKYTLNNKTFIYTQKTESYVACTTFNTINFNTNTYTFTEADIIGDINNSGINPDRHNALAISPSGKYIAVGGEYTPFFYIKKTSSPNKLKRTLE